MAVHKIGTKIKLLEDVGRGSPFAGIQKKGSRGVTVGERSSWDGSYKIQFDDYREVVSVHESKITTT